MCLLLSPHLTRKLLMNQREITALLSKLPPKDSLRLTKRLLWLEALEEAGVDAWEGIDFATILYLEMIEEGEDIA